MHSKLVRERPGLHCRAATASGTPRPRCNARRAHDTAIHLVERVLPHVPFRQWTLSFPKRIRWHLAKDARFGSALQLNIHFHVLAPEGLFAPPSEGTDERASFLPLPPPTDEEVEKLLRTVLRRVVRLLQRRGKLDEDAYPENAFEGLLAASLQRRLPLADETRPPRPKARGAFLEGFSLHANTFVHEHDRTSLARLCRYGARGPLALERLSRLEDGRLSYRLKRPAPDGSTHLVLTPLELLRLLAALIPPPRANLVHFHGVLAPNAKLRPRVVPQPPPPSPPPCVPPLPADQLPPSTQRPRLPWAELLQRTFALDVLQCNKCGGRRRVLAYISRVGGRRGTCRKVGADCAGRLSSARSPRPSRGPFPPRRSSTRTCGSCARLGHGPALGSTDGKA